MMRAFVPKKNNPSVIQYPRSELPAYLLSLISLEIPRPHMSISGLLRYAAEILRGAIDIDSDNTRG
jgi:hypothetical protein